MAQYLDGALYVGLDEQDATGFDLTPLHGARYFVDGISGSNSNSGLLRALPFLTMTYALAQCTNDNHDVIYVKDYYQASGETWPISVNKSLVSIIGYQDVFGGIFGGATAWNVMVASGSYPVFDVVANNVLISGFQLYAGTASYACITMDSGASVVMIDRCKFCRGTYGVHLTADDAGYGIQITNCYFLQSLASGGIYIDDDPAFTRIAGNHFDRLPGIAIRMVQGGAPRILNNDIALGSNTNGYAITLENAVYRAYVNGNHAAYGTESGTTFPYTDNGTVTDNNWGTNYFGSLTVNPT